MVIFRENTEDIYAGIEYAAGTPEAQKVLDFFAKEFPKEFKKIRFGTAEASRAGSRSSKASARRTREVGVQVGVGLKPISYLGTERLVHSAIGYAIAEQAQERHAGAQGQHHEVHRRAPSATGATRSRSTSSAPSRSTAGRGAASPTASRAPASSSRTRSPTSRCSRC